MGTGWFFNAAGRRLGKGGSVLGFYLGPPWEFLGLICERASNAVITVLALIKNLFEAAGCAVSAALFVARDVLSPCQPHGTLDCSRFSAYAAGGLARAHSTAVGWVRSLGKRAKAIPLVGFLGGFENPRETEDAGLSAYLEGLAGEVYTVKPAASWIDA